MEKHSESVRISLSHKDKMVYVTGHSRGSEITEQINLVSNVRQKSQHNRYLVDLAN